jgi:hypothetical protein
MTSEASTKFRRPLYSCLAIVCLLSSFPLAMVIVKFFSYKEDIMGFASVGLVMLTLIISFFVGLILGSVSLYRNEQPRLLSILSVFINLIALVWIVTKIPG